MSTFLALDFFEVDGSGIVSVSSSWVVVAEAARSLEAAGVKEKRSGGGGLKAKDGDIKNWGFGGNVSAASIVPFNKRKIEMVFLIAIIHSLLLFTFHVTFIKQGFRVGKL